MLPVFCFSGLGADERIFSDLDLGEELKIIPVKHITFKEEESLADYAKRLAEKIPNDQEVVLLGDSFGGMVAQEVSKYKNVKFIILTSTFKRRDVSGWHLGLAKRINAYKYVPSWLNKSLAIGVKYTHLKAEKEKIKTFVDMLSKFDPQFIKWIVKVVPEWEPPVLEAPCFHFHGTHDVIFPHFNRRDCILMKGLGHAMLFEDAPIVNEKIKETIYEKMGNLI